MDLISLTNMGLLFNTFKYTPDKNYIIEPYSCLIRIALLKYKPEGTKLSISENSITYNESSYIQGLLRAINSDRRDDLHNLFNPIYYSTKWYNLENKNNRFIFEQCLIGLSTLIETYDKKSIIYHTLLHYKSIITNYLESGQTIQVDSEQGDNKETEIETDIIKYIRNIWNDQEKLILYNLLYYLNDIDSDKGLIDLYCNIIESIVSEKESRINDYINLITSSY